MKTKIGLFCEQIIEVGWLLALIIAPLFFSVYSSRVFEPDKLSLVRTIATFMLAAALIHWIEGRQSASAGPRQSVQNFGQDDVGVEVLDQDAVEAGALSAIPLVGKAALLRIPLVVPTLLLALAYLLSTITSVVPRTSLWGSYQRLQGTYSTLSYMVIFALLLRYLRRHVQLQRLLFVVILTSVPISLYGLLQHYGLDPLPWGGDVTLRVASNMGNPIFVAAYVILVIPLTLAQILHNLDRALQECDRASRLVVYGVFGVVMLLIVWTWAALGFGRGLLMGVLGLLLFLLMGVYLRRPLAPFLLFGGYGLALAAQVTMLFFSQSRGPFLGIVAGLFFFALLVALIHRWRKALALGIGGALLILGFLVAVNLPASPLAGFRRLPYVGRLGQVFEIGGGTGKVRVLIWQGAVEMIRADPLRALIGYGPESMYVAYNPYYPPELAHYEARNASPDRSHNETFDALITAGAAGLLLYLLLFGSTLYYGLRWLGLIRFAQQRRFFVICAVGGLLLGLVVPILLDGGNWRFVGVGLPMGLVAGLSVYLALSALRATWGTGGPRPSADRTATQEAASQEAASDEIYRRVLLAALVSAIVAHFVEINFGIAIAATRTYFWAYAALLVVLGLRAIPLGQDEAGNRLIPSAANPGPGGKAEVLDKTAGRRASSRRRRRRSRPSSSPTWAAEARLQQPKRADLGALGALLGVILLTLAWDYTTNSLALTNPLAILLTALTTMAASQNAEQISLGMLWIVLSTFALGTVLAVAQVAQGWAHPDLDAHIGTGPNATKGSSQNAAKWVTAIGLVAAVAGTISGLFALIHAANLAPGANVPNLIYEYYLTIGVLWVGLAIFLYARSPEAAFGGQSASRDTAMRASTFAIYGLLFVVCLLFVDGANIRIVKADVIYKQGLRYDRAANWEQAIRFYEQAVEAAPSEDYYRLFYGRALMERAKLEKDEALRDAYFEKALQALAQARELNPLNTDHTANLARIYRTWAEYDADQAKRQEKLEKALELYAQAVELSPNSAQLWDEWGLVHYMLGDLDEAMAKYEHSLELDPQYAQTYLFMGEVYLKRQEWQKVIETHERALELEGNLIQAWSTVGYAYSQLGNWQKAIEANEKVLERAPDDYGTIKNMAILYNQAQKYDQALIYARRALELAPEKDRETIARFVAQLEAVQSPVSEAHKTAP